MGHISDRTKFGMGRRRPYFLISSVLVGTAFYLLWSPPAGLTDWGLFAYLTATYLFAFTCWTMFSIPHNALGAELTMDYHERTVLTGVREAVGMVGVLVGSMAPVIFAQIFGGERKGYSYLSIFTGAMTTLFIVLCFFNTKENPEFRKRHSASMKEGLKVLISNRPFRMLVVALLIIYIGQSFIPLMTPYVAFYVVKTPWVIPCVVGVYSLGAAFSIFFWTRLSRRIGKKETLSYGLMLACGVFAVCVYFHEGVWLDWIFLAVWAGIGVGSFMALAPSMIADTVDLDELETGMRREGAYFGIWSVIEKAGIGITAFIALQTLDVVGYVPNEEQTVVVFWTIKGLFCFVPAICFASAFFLLRRYPITKQEHDRIRAEIEAKKASEIESI
jgi:GPH family glycoside/pentoside/hexuronide:cation symporter